jgi:exosortase A-associated hydrolase 2
MRHLFFGDSSEPLFGSYHPPASSSLRRRAVVLCNPFGEEAIRAHRLYRVLATQLARTGFHVLRFDYRGTGDSFGDERSARLGAWLADVEVASREALDTAGVASVTWVGLRLGATLATLKASTGADGLSQLVLWDPVVDGATYLRDLATMHEEYLRQESPVDLRHPTSPASPEDLPSEALGHAISPELAAELSQVDLTTAGELGIRNVTVIVTSSTPESARLKAWLDGLGRGHRWITTEISLPWNSDAAVNRVLVPMDIVHLIVSTVEAAQ